MEQYTKEQVYLLSPEELLEYMNHMLSNGWTLNQLEKEKGIVKRRTSGIFKKIGYKYDSKLKQYVSSEQTINELTHDSGVLVPFEPVVEPKSKKSTITLEALEKRVKALEMRLNGITETPTTKDAKVMQFSSKAQDRNYPLHQEVIELLDELKAANTHLKVKDLVNTALYIGLTELKDSNR
ncbi:hypothetical protein PNV01_13425 [Turicibacter sanguinis]|uniref:hypothetical protein n=1 Tax=Turicibacter sanguinis TaxID=154288 RepID=UPI00232D071F|nr:hypothetical protein [Turicibacter sanguinis]MDB8545804.1 hypothetical protein [Turicibacter sanguinis]